MIDKINQALWLVATVLLIGGGIYFTFRLSFVQLRFKTMFRSFKTKEKEEISPFKSLTMALAARIGVGSLAGIALAIHLGGIGTIFWIWISSFLTIQANTIAASLSTSVAMQPIVTGIIIAIVTAFIIFKGLKGISDATSKLVPIMGIGYLLISAIILTSHLNELPALFLAIIQDAFTIKSAIIGVFTTFLIGIQRGIFATESGLGSGAIASATTDSNNKIGQGMIQMLGIYFTTFVICTSTAFIILTSDYQTLLFENINGIEITQYALTYHLGNLGSVFLNLVIIFFAFSTILTGYYYGEVNFKYLVPNWKNSMLVILKIITILLLLWGSVAKATFLWNIVDILVALMAIINMYALFRLRQEVVKEYKSYQQKSG